MCHQRPIIPSGGSAEESREASGLVEYPVCSTPSGCLVLCCSVCLVLLEWFMLFLFLALSQGSPSADQVRNRFSFEPEGRGN